MARFHLAALALLAFAPVGAAMAQATPPLPSMPRPPSFSESSPAATPKATRKAKKPGASAASSSGSGSSFERPSKFVPAEFDQERRGGGGARAQPIMSGSGQPGMGMKF